MSAATPAYDTLTQTYARLHRLGHLQSMAGWDQAAKMPPKGNGARAAALSEMAALLHRMRTDADLADAMTALAPSSDVIVMAAAPADFTPAHPSDGKLKKSGDAGLTVEFTQTTDVLAEPAVETAPAEPIEVAHGFVAERFEPGQ